MDNNGMTPTTTPASAFEQGVAFGRQLAKAEAQEAKIAALEAHQKDLDDRIAELETVFEEPETETGDGENTGARTTSAKDDGDETDEGAPLETPSSQDRSGAGTARRRDAAATEAPAYELDELGWVKRRAGERHAQYIARVKRLPPLGPEAQNGFDRQRLHRRVGHDVYDAHRHDGTKDT